MQFERLYDKRNVRLAVWKKNWLGVSILNCILNSTRVWNLTCKPTDSINNWFSLFYTLVPFTERVLFNKDKHCLYAPSAFKGCAYIYTHLMEISMSASELQKDSSWKTLSNSTRILTDTCRVYTTYKENIFKYMYGVCTKSQVYYLLYTITE